ncbi:hypothetical protein chiPu_0028856, partial [Chiloscyllium punctatum]|nr:hypothetical protein [Chiloscyllium punctatum]
PSLVLCSSSALSCWCLPSDAPYLRCTDLNRFSFSRYAIRKSTAHVEFPLYGLSLRQFAADKAGNPVYDLYAVCNHTGTVNGGHYTAYCRSGGRWHVYNDSRLVLRLVPRHSAIPGSFRRWWGAGVGRRRGQGE